jgi:hypothetical protein
MDDVRPVPIRGVHKMADIDLVLRVMNGTPNDRVKTAEYRCTEANRAMDWKYQEYQDAVQAAALCEEVLLAACRAQEEDDDK